MKKQTLNKKLRSRILDVKETGCMKYGKVQVIRARQRKNGSGEYVWTEVDIRICAIVKNTLDEWRPLNSFGPRSVRKFLRRHNNNVPNTVNSWTKLWGFPSDTNITIKNIELVTNPCTL